MSEWKSASAVPLSPHITFLIAYLLNLFADTMIRMIKTLNPSKRIINLLIVIGVVIFIATGITWWYLIRNNPERVFYAMLNNNLRTSSVTRHVQQDTPQQTLDQRIKLQTGERHVAFSDTVISQNGANSTTVRTESIGTPEADYVRYTDIDTTQQTEEGEDLDFSNVIGVWGKTQETPQGTTDGELYNELVLGVVPFGNVSDDRRDALLQLIREQDVYQIDFNNVVRSTDGVRPTYTYKVTVQPQAYITYLKAYAEAVGLTQLANVDPASYQNTQPLEFDITVDVLSQRLDSIEFTNGRTENYESYGVTEEIDIPTDTIPVQELQSRITEAQ